MQCFKSKIFFINRFFEWETLKGGKKQPYYIYLKKDTKIEAQNKTMTEIEGENNNEKETDVKDFHIKKEPEESITVKAEEDAQFGEKRLLTMAGLFDCWKPPNVCDSSAVQKLISSHCQILKVL